MITIEDLNKAESQCLGAVGHVAYANYTEREREAQGYVTTVFRNLRCKLISEKPKHTPVFNKIICQMS